jgi:hypothetical protein
MALAALELLPMAWREAAVPSHVVLAPVSAFSKSAKAKPKTLKEFVIHAGFISRLHILGLGGYEQNNHEQNSRFLRNLMTVAPHLIGRPSGKPPPAVLAIRVVRCGSAGGFGTKRSPSPNWSKGELQSVRWCPSPERV